MKRYYKIAIIIGFAIFLIYSIICDIGLYIWFDLKYRWTFFCGRIKKDLLSNDTKKGQI